MSLYAHTMSESNSDKNTSSEHIEESICTNPSTIKSDLDEHENKLRMILEMLQRQAEEDETRAAEEERWSKQVSDRLKELEEGVANIQVVHTNSSRALIEDLKEINRMVQERLQFDEWYAQLKGS